MKLLHWAYPSFVGLLLGLLQTGLFFQLSFTLSSSFQTFLMITVCWLIGSVLGVRIANQVNLPLNIFIVLGLCAYFICAILLDLAPFDTDLWLVYALLIILTGIYPGVFFIRLGKHYTARQLFLRENNGFIVGLIGCTLLFLIFGRVVLWVLPLLVAGIVMICTQIYFQHDSRMSTIRAEMSLTEG